eukprot:TRINITY_DN4522_c0_g1_i6.p1 TRINITY_DN4522_c0_g1~~TRINITY_DN4522_c0_g1_i6.p1  ORF type:complete len:229 (-),score=79.52 TRINITY_DN4522_c0_g1_i6:235-921(-)
MLEDEMEQAEIPLKFLFSISSEEVTLERVTDTLKECKKVLDDIWTQMAVPPPEASSMSKKQAREAMRQQRQTLLPSEKSTKKLYDELKGLQGVLIDAQKLDQNQEDNVRDMHGTETEELKLARGNQRVQKALNDVPIAAVTEQTLLAPVDEPLNKQLRHILQLGASSGKQSAAKDGEDGDSEKQGWNRSVFIDKQGKYEAPSNTKRCGFREFKADPWYRSMKPHGRYG